MTILVLPSGPLRGTVAVSHTDSAPVSSPKGRKVVPGKPYFTGGKGRTGARTSPRSARSPGRGSDYTALDTMPWTCAQWLASVRFATCSFSYMFDRWNLTVCSVTQSIWASCAFE
jgi:hypothetical protein